MGNFGQREIQTQKRVVEQNWTVGLADRAYPANNIRGLLVSIVLSLPIGAVLLDGVGG